MIFHLFSIFRFCSFVHHDDTDFQKSLGASLGNKAVIQVQQINQPLLLVGNWSPGARKLNIQNEELATQQLETNPAFNKVVAYNQPKLHSYLPLATPCVSSTLSPQNIGGSLPETLDT